MRATEELLRRIEKLERKVSFLEEVNNKTNAELNGLRFQKYMNPPVEKDMIDRQALLALMEMQESGIAAGNDGSVELSWNLAKDLIRGM